MPGIKSTLCGYKACWESPKVIWSVYNVKPTMIKLQATKKSGIHEKNAFYAQSGGVTAVINALACGVIEACRNYSDKIGILYAGLIGLLAL